MTVGRADSVFDQLGSVRPTGRPGVPSGEQALLALLESGDFTTEGSSRELTTNGSATDFTTEGYARVMSESEEEQDRSTGRDDHDKLRYRDSLKRQKGSVDQDVSKNRADHVRSRYRDGNTSATNTVWQIKSISRNRNNPSKLKHSKGQSRSNIVVSQEKSRNGNDLVRSQNVVVRKKSRGDVRSRMVKNKLRKSHKHVNMRRHGDDRENRKHGDMHAQARSKTRLSPENIPDDLLKSVPYLADQEFRNTGSFEQTTIDSILQTRFFQNKGRTGQAKPSKTIATFEVEQSVPKPRLPMELEISQTGKIIVTTEKELLKQGIYVSNTSVMNQISRNNSDRKKINGKGRSFNQKQKQTSVAEMPRKNERNIRTRVHTKQNITKEKDYNENKPSDENLKRNSKLNRNNYLTMFFLFIICIHAHWILPNPKLKQHN